jgi:hypothetical protein
MSNRQLGENERVARDARELALVDRILGLEAQLANYAVIVSPSRTQFESLNREIAGLRQQLAAVHSTRTWKAGRAVLSPLRAIRALTRRAQD